MNFYRKAIKLRKELSAVRHGNYTEYGKYSSTLYTYTREDEKQKLLVVCSFSENLEKWDIPAGFDMEKAELILCNYENVDATVMKPYEARVYCWEK